MITKMTDLDKLFILHTSDSFSEVEDRKFFKEFYETMSLEEQFERGKLTEEEYDAMFEERRLREKGTI